jgi:hypothetical protein
MCISKLRVGNYFHSYTSSKNLFGGTTNSKLRVGHYFSSSPKEILVSYGLVTTFILIVSNSKLRVGNYFHTNSK